jgi:hypothetical protein
MCVEQRHDDRPFLKLAPSARVRITYLVVGALLAAIPTTFFVMGWNEERSQTIILGGLMALFCFPTIQGMTRRMWFFDARIESRILWVWVSRCPPDDLEFQELMNNPNPYASVAATIFGLPNDIVARRPGRRRIWLRIPGDLLSCLGEGEYRKALADLRERYGRRADLPI